TYMLANGQGKVRMARAGGTRKPLQWRLLFLSSGEIGLRDHMMSVAVKVRGGQEIRCLVPAITHGTAPGARGRLGDGDVGQALHSPRRPEHPVNQPALLTRERENS